MPAKTATNIVVDVYVMARVEAWAKARGVSVDDALLFLLGGFDKPAEKKQTRSVQK